MAGREILRGQWSQENVEIVRAAYDAFNRGHRDARFTFRVYQRAAKRRERLAGEHLAAFRPGARMGRDGQGARS
ncbi:MAG TPA: hypothetical protein VN458_11480 [Solirubrobacterales bacterium]|nr:hypothetical protein [Solirubrobacterales bacterium]